MVKYRSLLKEGDETFFEDFKRKVIALEVLLDSSTPSILLQMI